MCTLHTLTSGHLTRAATVLAYPGPPPQARYVSHATPPARYKLQPRSCACCPPSRRRRPHPAAALAARLPYPRLAPQQRGPRPQGPLPHHFQVVQDAFLGCANPEYPFIEKRFWPTQTSALAIDIQSNGVVLLKENVKIPIDGGTLSAQSASYDSNSQSVQEIQQGSLYYLDSYFQFQSGSLNGQSKNFSFVDGKSYLAQRNLLIEYESLTGEFGTNLLFNDARLTSCLQFIEYNKTSINRHYFFIH